MICSSCDRDVVTLYGNGTYPNSTYQCGKCHDDEMGKIVGRIIIGLVLVIIVIAIIELIP